MDSRIIRVLAIDTQRWRSRAGVVVERQIELIGDTDTDTVFERFKRIRQARRELALFVALIPSIDVVAYEKPFHRGGAPTEALFQAIGMLLGLSAFDDLPIFEIATQTVKAQQGLVKASRTAAPAVRGGQAKKIAGIKSAAVDWANIRVTLPTPLLEGQDAIADAIGVGLGAFSKWQDEQYLKEQAAARQGTLTLRRSPRTKK